MDYQMMSLMLERCAQALEETVGPHVTDPFATAQVNAISQLLKSLAPAVDINSLVLHQDNDSMRVVLSAVAEDLRSLAPDTILQIDEQLPNGRLAGAQEVAQANAYLKGLLVSAIEQLDTLESQLPAVDFQPVRRRIRKVLREQLDN